MAKAGRPKKEIDKKLFEFLCSLQCTQMEICAGCGVTVKTLEKWCQETYGQDYSTVYNLKRQNGKISLRRSQMKLAERNASMSIWLGKQMLGQTDQVTATQDTANSTEEFISALNGSAEKVWSE